MFTFLFLFSEGLISYIIPKGVQRGNEVELIDKTYDGDDEGDRLVSGLGQLVDGQKGVDNFRIDVNGFGKGKHIGWGRKTGKEICEEDKNNERNILDNKEAKLEIKEILKESEGRERLRIHKDSLIFDECF